jgi:hypothetical protein
MVFNLLEKFMRDFHNKNEAQEGNVLEKLCNSKSKSQDKQILKEGIFGKESLKLSLIKKMISGFEECKEQKDHILSEAISQFSGNETVNLDLSMACILEFSTRAEEQELILRNRLEKKRLSKYLNLLENLDYSESDSESKDLAEEQKEDLFSLPVQNKIKSQIASSDPNQIVMALEELVTEIKKSKSSSIDVIRDICKVSVGPIFAAKHQDPLISELIFELIIKIGIDEKNERAVVTKLEQFAEEWPLVARRLVETLLQFVQDKSLKTRLETLKVDRVPGEPLILEDMIPSYLLPKEGTENEACGKSKEAENFFA